MSRAPSLPYGVLFLRAAPGRDRLLRALALLVVAALVAGCASTGEPPDESAGGNQTDNPDVQGDEPGADNASSDGALVNETGFESRLVATGLRAPHNILYGPDGALWVTERDTGNVVRIDPVNGTRLSVMPIDEVYRGGGQDGLMGMAFGPGFLTGEGPHRVYVAYTYNASDGSGGERTKVARFDYDPDAQALTNQTDLIANLSASVDHNSGRIVFGADGMMYYTIGDQGKNQFTRFCEANRAQMLPTQAQVDDEDWTAYEGKVLRLAPDGSVPADNPTIEGVRSHVYTYGHRNPQGMAFGPDGALYVSEHGDKSDDEINRLQPGGNYGWPYVSGYRDDSAYQYVNWSAADDCETLTFTNLEAPPSSVPVLNESDFADEIVEPVATFYTVETDHDFTDPACADVPYVCWPTVAPSSLRLYEGDAIPGWEGTFLMPTLKGGRIFHVDLAMNATAGEPPELFRAEDRYRDVAFSPDGRTLFVITDPQGPVQAIEGGPADELSTPGALLAFTYVGGGAGSGTAS